MSKFSGSCAPQILVNCNLYYYFPELQTHLDENENSQEGHFYYKRFLILLLLFMRQPLTTLTRNETFNLEILTIGRSLGREVLKTCNKLH